jgi:ribosomal protein S8
MDLLNILLARLKQSSKRSLSSTFCFNSIFCVHVLQLLVRLNYIKGFSIINKKFIKIYLKYYNNKCVFRNIVRVSTPGKRVY